MTLDVIGIGKPNLDHLVCTLEPPKPNSLVFVEETSWQGGGKAATALVTLARLGASAGMLAILADDPYGKFCMDDFKRHGVDTSRIQIDEGTVNNYSVVASDKMTQSRIIYQTRGSHRNLEPEDMDKDYIAGAKYLHLEKVAPYALTAAQYAREKGVKVVLDADFGCVKDIGGILPFIDVLIASEDFYDNYFHPAPANYREACSRIMEKGPQLAVFTFGRNGSVVMDREGYFHIPAYEVEVVDTTGAGDVYHGAFIFGLLQGWSAGETAKFASAVGAIKCTRIGGRAAIPDYRTAMQFMKTGVIDYSEIDKRVEYYKKPALFR